MRYLGAHPYWLFKLIALIILTTLVGLSLPAASSSTAPNSRFCPITI